MTRNEVLVKNIINTQKRVARAHQSGLVVGFWADEVVLKKEAIRLFPQEWTVSPNKNGDGYALKTFFEGVVIKVFLTKAEYGEIFSFSGS